MSDISETKVVCPVCDEPILISEIEEHNETNHRKVGLVPVIVPDFGEPG